MVNICFTHDPDENSQKQWDYVLLNFRPDKLYIISDGGPEFSRRSPRSKAIIIKNIKELPENIPLIVLAPKLAEYVKGEVSLVDFKHPKDAVYFFGPDVGHLTKEYFKSRKPDQLVYIPVDTDDQMFSFMAAAVIMWDRRIRSG